MDSTYSNDQPVSKVDQDVFQRYEFSKRIAKTIQNDKIDECKVIGLHGVWGEGKTSVLNFINEELSNDSTVKVVKFNPWRYKGEEELLVSFFKTITRKLDKNLYNFFENIFKKADKIRFLSPFINTIIKLFADPSSKIDVSDLFKFLSTTDVELLKERVNNYLKESPYYLIVIIDDIDRLDKNEIYSIMKMVKLTADFVKTTYILSFDNKMVASAIGERFATGDIDAGYSFLEKIIQVSIRLPKIPLTLLRKYALEKIYNSLSKNKISIEEEEIKNFERLFEQSIIPRLYTPRLAVRYANSLSFSVPILLGEVNTVDFMLIEALKIFYGVHYEYIKNNPDYFSNTSFINHELVEDDNSYERILSDLSSNLNDNEKGAVASLISYLFPVTEKYDNENIRFTKTKQGEWYRLKRVASKDYFDRYFTYSINNDQISDITISEFIEKSDKESNERLLLQVKTLVTASSADEFLTKIIHADLNWLSKNNIINSVINLPEFFKRDGQQVDSSLTNRLVVFIFETLLQNNDTESRYKLAKQMMIKAYSFDLAYEINNETRRSFRNNEQLFSSDQYTELGSILRDRAIRDAENKPLFETIQKVNQLNFLFINWLKVDSLEFRNYVSEIIHKNPEKIKYLIMGLTPEIRTFLNNNEYRKTNFSDRDFIKFSEMIDSTEVYNLLIQNFENEIRQQEPIYLDGFDDTQTYDNVVRQFVECYNKNNANKN